MAEYRYYLIPDAMTRAFPEQFGKQTPTEFFDNIADLEKRYHQLREMPYNNERTWNERTRFPYARLVVGIDRQNPDGAVAIIQVRNGVNYLCDDYRGPYADRSDAQIPQMAKKLVEVIGVDRVRPHTYTQRDGYTWVQVEKDMHITEWLYAHELCSSLQFTRFLNRDGRELFQVRDGQRVIETNADGTKRLRAVKNIDVTHAYVGHYTCSEGDDACGQYDAAAEWHWNEGHAENESYTVWKENGTHDVTVFFPVIFPDGATGSELSDLPEEYNAVADGKIKAADCTGNIVLDDSANLYKGELNDWFYTPDELTVTFTVVTGEGDDAVSDDYEVTFSNATAIPWCPGELNDGQYGHYDLDCTIYLTGYDRYTDPETQAPNGADGGTGNLEALAESCDAGTLTRTIIKQDQYGNEYAGNAVSARYTKTITLPNGARGFQGWYKDGEDAYGNVEWASLLYRMDWEELYGIVDGIKCRATGSGMTEEELRQLFASLNIDATTARGQVVAFALSCQGKFVYAQPSSLRGGPGNPSVGINLDCSSFVQYCYWAQNLPFSAGSTAAYRNAADLVSISPSEVQPGDLRVVYASGGEQGHVQMALGGDAWIECCYGYGVAVNMSNAWMESRPCYYFRYAGF